MLHKMPKLYAFVTCEKVITDSEGFSSLIALFNELTVFISEGSPSPPANAVAAREWAIFTSWEGEPADDGKEFRQIFQLLYPDGTPFGQEMAFLFTVHADKRYNQVIAKSMGFPIGQPGKYLIQMRLEQDGSTVFGPEAIRMDVKYSAPAQVSQASAS